jgi:hypothetical protein
MPGKTISDYVIALREKGIEELASSLHSVKAKDYQRLKNSGLPVYADFSLQIPEFTHNNRRLNDFLKKYKEVTIRALPKTSDLPRRYKIQARGYEECKEFLNKEVPKDKEPQYTCLLTEHKPSNGCGIIILRKDLAIVEVTEEGLAEFSHDQTLCYTGIFGIFDRHKFRKLKLRAPRKGRIKNKLKNMMSQSLNHITKAGLIEETGYFEFVNTNSGIKFLDYKTNPVYLSQSIELKL